MPCSRTNRGASMTYLPKVTRTCTAPPGARTPLNTSNPADSEGNYSQKA